MGMLLLLGLVSFIGKYTLQLNISTCWYTMYTSLGQYFYVNTTTHRVVGHARGRDLTGLKNDKKWLRQLQAYGDRKLLVQLQRNLQQVTSNTYWICVRNFVRFRWIVPKKIEVVYKIAYQTSRLSMRKKIQTLFVEMQCKFVKAVTQNWMDGFSWNKKCLNDYVLNRLWY